MPNVKIKHFRLGLLCRRAPWLMKTEIPPLLQYPIGAQAYRFTASLIAMFYAPSLGGSARGLWGLAACFLPFLGGGAAPKPSSKEQ